MVMAELWALPVPPPQLKELAPMEVLLAFFADVATPAFEIGLPKVTIAPNPVQLMGLGGGLAANADEITAPTVPTGSPNASTPITIFRRVFIFSSFLSLNFPYSRCPPASTRSRNNAMNPRSREK